MKPSDILPKGVIDLAHQIGVKLWCRNCQDSFSWNGRTIALFEGRNRRQRGIDNIVHDIAHYMVCDEDRRDVPEFGLGESPDIGVRYIRCLLTPEHAQEEEEEASLLGILLERELGTEWQKTFEYHSWDIARGDAGKSLDVMLRQFKQGKDGGVAIKALHRLHQKKLITKQGKVCRRTLTS